MKQGAGGLLTDVGHPNGVLVRIRQDQDPMDELSRIKCRLVRISTSTSSAPSIRVHGTQVTYEDSAVEGHNHERDIERVSRRPINHSNQDVTNFPERHQSKGKAQARRPQLTEEPALPATKQVTSSTTAQTASNKKVSIGKRD